MKRSKSLFDDFSAKHTRVKNRSYLLKTVFMIFYLITDNSRKIRMQGYWISPDKRPVKEKPERKEKLLWIL